MEKKKIDDNFTNKRLQSITEMFTKYKTDYLHAKEECKNLKENNMKLIAELKEFKELEKSHRYHLQNTREMIGNQQDTISQLIYLKRDGKKLNDEIIFKNATIAALEKDKETMTNTHNANLLELRSFYETQIEEIKSENERKTHQAQLNAENKLAKSLCEIEGLNRQLKEMKAEHVNKMNTTVLEYEEKIQVSEARVAQLQEQLARQTARTDANIDIYRRKVEELEEKLKQSKFKDFLAQNIYSSQCDIVERPYSRGEGLCASTSSNVNRDTDSPRPGLNYAMRPNKAPRASNSLQITYVDSKTPSTNLSNDKKGPFNIVKKRKLYTEKGFQDF